MSFFQNNLRFQIIFPLSLIMAVMLAVLSFSIPILVKRNAEQHAIHTALNSLKQMKVLRAYYTKNIVKKVQEFGVLKPAIKHLGEPDKIPLPATMIHDLSQLFDEDGSKLSLYSAYPFPNRQHIALDPFQQKAWLRLNDNPSQIISAVNNINSHTILRVAISDQMQVQACVDCHNNHPLTPKADWQIGDVRGVLEMSIDISSQLALANTLSLWIISCMLIACILLIILFYFLTGKITEQVSNISQGMIALGKGNYEIELPQDSTTLETHQMYTAFKLFKTALLERQALENQQQVFETEKVNSLGRMVASIAHDVNTPIGISVTATGFLQDEIELLAKKFASGELNEEDFESFLASSQSSMTILSRNLSSAADLIRSFKQVSVDQMSEQAREVLISEYFKEVIHSMLPKTKRAQVTVDLDCVEDRACFIFPGLLSQVITNLISNSIIHGFPEQNGGSITLVVSAQEHEVSIHYRDNGIGISDDILPKVMDPFFTTNRDEGGSGLGLSIIHNIITQKLNGHIKLTSGLGKGLTVDISFPVLQAAAN
ncbi:Signal transduction histidine kinase-like protein [Shewanella sediminis HAW-EB3]|uniref:histidine kinase n=1 Tax=Shewanella sediminis (strain HAW-EB3) TaxID=425104 RepID=A8FR03_SHESH|nr:ATP-binding protein [Shewanella sediminis]ABV35276.1 Signal transduction histidine kinase-like protein [Shewanella sediminis HAW-EB3]